MAMKPNIQKWLMISLWIFLSAGVMTLLVAAIQKKKQKAIKDVVVEIVGAHNYVFVDEADVKQIASTANGASINGESVGQLRMKKMEEALEKDEWIKDAELFIDNNNVLHIKIFEREPVARVFNTKGDNFYVDSSGMMLNVNNNTGVRMPVFTSFSGGMQKMNAFDSSVLMQLKNIGQFIVNDSFWNAQIAQVDITSTGNFEMVPLFGNHLIVFGDGNHIENKFKRLMGFYEQVLSKVGMEKYERIDVQYEKQIVATRRGATKVNVDSIQSVLTMNNILANAEQQIKDTSAPVQINSNRPATMNEGDLDLIPNTDSIQRPVTMQTPKPVVPVTTNPKPPVTVPATTHTTTPKPNMSTPVVPHTITTPKPIVTTPKPSIQQKPKPKPANNTPKPNNKPRAVMPKQ
jgi:cell division protein FtsQ